MKQLIRELSVQEISFVSGGAGLLSGVPEAGAALEALGLSAKLLGDVGKVSDDAIYGAQTEITGSLLPL